MRNYFFSGANGNTLWPMAEHYDYLWFNLHLNCKCHFIESYYLDIRQDKILAQSQYNPYIKVIG